MRREPTTLRHRQTKTIAAIHAIRFSPIRLSDNSILFETASRVETIIPCSPKSHRPITIVSSARTQYHKYRPMRDERNSENCCRYCGILAPSFSKAFRNLLVDKDLNFPRFGPRSPNRVLPAQVLSYVCPEIHSVGNDW